MKTNHFAAAFAGAMLMHTSASMALAPDQPVQYHVKMSGATAQDRNLGQLFADLCVPGSLDEYFDGPTGNAGGNHRAYFCKIDSSKVTGLSSSNPNVLFSKTSTTKTAGGNIGGSGIGVNPVLLKLPVDVMSINNGNCVAPVTGENYWRCRITQPGDVSQIVPDAGISDVNPSLFIGANTPTGVSPVDAAQASRLLTVKSGGALVFNTPVTTQLRNALQRAQIAAGNLATDCAGKETEACMPSLTKAQIASLMTGAVANWEGVKIGGRSLTEFAEGSTTDSKVYICRRTNGSGTGATINAKVLDVPCSVAAANPLETSNDLIGPVVRLNAGSGNVDSCLADLNDGTNTGGQNAAAVKAWAIGVQSTERNANNKLNYRYIKVDGFAPTLENAASNKYGIVAEVTYQWLKTGGPTGDIAKIIARVATDAGKPSIVAKNNASYKYTWGQAGYLAVASEGWAVTPGPFDINNPVWAYTHVDPQTGILDNCRVPVLFK
jgi:hypothetical protein